jgi:hypothetical protein
MPYGLIMISHAKEKEVKTRTGTVAKIAPTLTGGAYDVVANMCDFILYAEAEEVRDEQGSVTDIRRVLHCQPTTWYDAGNRSQFVIPDPLPLDYKAFAAALRQNTSTPVAPAADDNKKTLPEAAEKKGR